MSIRKYKWNEGKVFIPPYRTVKFRVDLSQYFWQPSKENECGVLCYINFRYYNKNKKKGGFSTINTDYLKLGL